MEETFETTVDIPISAYIPDSYIRNEEDRMEIYKRIAAVETEEESMDMIDELIDRFGSVPKPVTNLLEVSILRANAHSLYIKEIKSSSTEIRLFMHPRAKLTRCVCRILYSLTEVHFVCLTKTILISY